MSPTLTHIALHVSDLEASKAFYQAFCGLEVCHERHDGGTERRQDGEHGVEHRHGEGERLWRRRGVVAVSDRKKTVGTAPVTYSHPCRRRRGHCAHCTTVAVAATSFSASSRQHGMKRSALPLVLARSSQPRAQADPSGAVGAVTAAAAASAVAPVQGDGG